MSAQFYDNSMAAVNKYVTQPLQNIQNGITNASLPPLSTPNLPSQFAINSNFQTPPSIPPDQALPPIAMLPPTSLSNQPLPNMQTPIMPSNQFNPSPSFSGNGMPQANAYPQLALQTNFPQTNQVNPYSFPNQTNNNPSFSQTNYTSPPVTNVPLPLSKPPVNIPRPAQSTTTNPIQNIPSYMSNLPPEESPYNVRSNLGISSLYNSNIALPDSAGPVPSYYRNYSTQNQAQLSKHPFAPPPELYPTPPKPITDPSLNPQYPPYTSPTLPSTSPSSNKFFGSNPGPVVVDRRELGSAEAPPFGFFNGPAQYRQAGAGISGFAGVGIGGNSVMVQNEQVMQQMESMFRRYDSDGSGAIGLSELKLIMEDFCKDLKIPPLAYYDVQQLFYLFDYDKDGRLTFNEFQLIVEVLKGISDRIRAGLPPLAT